MTWGIFKKTADLAKKIGQTAKNVVIPTFKKAVEFGKEAYETAKPLIGETSWGKNIGKALDYGTKAIEYSDDVSDIMDSKNIGTAFKRGVDLYQRSKNYK